MSYMTCCLDDVGSEIRPTSGVIRLRKVSVVARERVVTIIVYNSR